MSSLCARDAAAAYMAGRGRDEALRVRGRHELGPLHHAPIFHHIYT
jgi:hypothetical protein